MKMKTSLFLTLVAASVALARDSPRRTPSHRRRQLVPAAPAPAFIASSVVPLVMNGTAPPAAGGVTPAALNAEATLASIIRGEATASSTVSGTLPEPTQPPDVEGENKGEGAPPPPPEAGAPPPAGGGELDAVVLAFAATLEDFESQLYNAALGFSPEQWQQAGFSSSQIVIIQQSIQTIIIDETTHLKVLSDALAGAGAPFQKKCSFDFSSVSDPLQFLSIARAVETVGIGAYQGAAPLVSPAVLAAALQIHPVEARHTALISLLTGDSPSPNAFDLPLAASEVLSIAGGFFSGCTAEDLGLTANKPLVCSNKNGSGGEFKIGSQLAFTSNVELPDTTFCQIIIPGQSAPIIMPISQCIVPEQAVGNVWIFVTTDETPLSVGDSQARATAGNLCAGPAQVLVQPEHNGFADFFSSALEVGHINGAQCGINQLEGYRNGNLNLHGVNVINVVQQKEVVVIINNDNDDDKDRKDRGKKRQRKYQLGGRRSEH